MELISGSSGIVLTFNTSIILLKIYWHQRVFECQFRMVSYEEIVGYMAKVDFVEDFGHLTEKLETKYLHKTNLYDVYNLHGEIGIHRSKTTELWSKNVFLTVFRGDFWDTRVSYFNRKTPLNIT